MATTCKISDGTNTLDFSGSGVLSLGHDYRPTIAPIAGDGGDPGPVIETMPLIATPTDADALAGALQTLDLLRRRAAEYQLDRRIETPVWIHQKLDGETGERIALVHAIEVALDFNPYATRPAITDQRPLSIAVTRSAYWERSSHRDFPRASPSALPFDSGDTAPTVGETLTGASSGSTGKVSGYSLVSGTFGAGTAAGWIYFFHASTVWTDNEELNGSVGGSSMMQVAGTTVDFPPAILYDYTAAGYGVAAHDIAGDLSARIGRLIIEPMVGAVGRLWIGLRSADRYGQTLNNIVWLWELAEATLSAAETGVTVETDSTANAGQMVEITEVDLDWDDTWHEALSLEISDITSQEADHFGTFLWLLRARADVSTTWEIQLRFGYIEMADADYIRGPIVDITGPDPTLWDILEMGPATIPFRNLQAIPTTWLSDSNEGEFAIQLWARRTSGSGDLNLDCLIPIPIDEGYLILKKLEDTEMGGAIYIGESPRLELDATAEPGRGGIFSAQPEIEDYTFQLPPGDGRMVIAYAAEDQSTLDDGIFLGSTLYADFGEYYERWSALRGSD